MVIGLLTSISIMMVNAGFADMKIRTTYVQLQTVIAATQDYVSSTHNYSVTTDDILSQESLPKAITPSSGGILIGYQKVTVSGSSDHVDIKIQNLSRRACMRLLNYNFGSRIVSRSANQTTPLYSLDPNLHYGENACALSGANSIVFSTK